MRLFQISVFRNRTIKKALLRDAIIIDVRSAAEYDIGHITEAINIPVDRININLSKIKAKNKPVVLCCNSGERSSIALQYLKTYGVTEVYNGGNWEKLLKITRRL